MKPSNAEVLAVVRMVRGAEDELEALRLMAVFVARVEGETGADFDRTVASYEHKYAQTSQLSDGKRPDLVPSLLKSDVGTNEEKP